MGKTNKIQKKKVRTFPRDLKVPAGMKVPRQSAAHHAPNIPIVHCSAGVAVTCAAQGSSARHRQYYAREMWEYLESLITYTCCLRWLWTGSGLRRTTFLIFGKHVNMFSLLPGEVRCCELRWTELLCVAWCEQFPSANDMKWYDLVISVIISVNSTRFTQQPAHSIHCQINSNNIMSEQGCEQQNNFHIPNRQEPLKLKH